MRGAAYLLPIVAVACACDLFQDDPCEFESEFIPGFEVTGLGLATNGRGYLTGIARFGKCTGTVEGRFFKVDTETQTAEPIPNDYLLGKVLVASDGERALAMGHKIPFVGVIGGTPSGALLIQGASTTSLDLGGAALDIQPARDGWIASTLGGSWHVSFDGTTTQLIAGESRCGAESGSWRVLCAGGDVKVIDSSGAIVNTLSLGSAPTFAVASGNTAIVVHGTAATAIVSGTLEQTYSLLGAVGGDAWIAPNAFNALIQGSLGTRWLRLEDGTSDVTGDNQFAVDVGFSADGRFGLVADGDFGLYGIVDFVARDLGVDVGPGRTSAFESVGGRVFVLAAGNDMQVFRRGDVLPGAFQKIEVVSAENYSVVRLATWDLVVE